MACQVQNQYQRYEQATPSILAHHELVLKKLSALSMYMEAQGKGALDSASGAPDGPHTRNSEAVRDWFGGAESHYASGHFHPPQSAARPIPLPAFQFSAQSAAAAPLSASAPSVTPLSHRDFPCAGNPSPLPRVASFSNGWHETAKGDRGRESLAACAARFYEQKRRASIASHKASSPLSQGPRPFPEHGNNSPPALFFPREFSQDLLERLGSSASARRSSPGASSGDGGFFFAPGDKHRVLSHFSSSPSSSLGSVLSAGGGFGDSNPEVGSGDSNPVSPNRTDSDGSGHSSSMDGAIKARGRDWELEAESGLAKQPVEKGEDRLAPLVGRGLRRGLSQHYGGKSRSFHSLADVVTSPIQDLAKPDNPYAKRRKNNNGSHSNLLGRAAGCGNVANINQKSMLADNLGFRNSEMDDVEGAPSEWAAEGGDVATALRPVGQFQPLRSQSMADLRAIRRRRACPEY